MNKEKGAFYGCKDVFLFTFHQGTKVKGFIGSTVGFACLLLLAFCILNVVMAVKSDKEVEPLAIERVYVKDESGLEGLDFKAFLSTLTEEQGKRYEHIVFEETGDLKERLEGEEAVGGKTVGLHVVRESDRYLMELWLPEQSEVTDKDGKKLLDVLTGSLEQGKLLNSGIAVEKLILAKAPVETQFTDAGEEVESVMEMVTKMLVPMVCCLLVYFMLILYGQSIAKIVMVEKASKLMEMLLTSIKPYAIIFGKILAMASIAILQMLIWIASGTIGFFLGDAIANQISPGYDNVVFQTVELLRNHSGSHAFTPLSVLLAIAILCIGFLFYSMLAGLVASSIQKSEDLAQGMSLYQIAVIVSFMVPYIGSLGDATNRIFSYIPFTGVYILPGELLVGKAGLVDGLIGLGILVAATFLLVMITGKVYKDKVFHQGDTMSSRFMVWKNLFR